MTRVFSVFAMFAFAAVIGAQSVSQDVLSAENARVRARQRADSDARTLMSDDFFQINSNGRVLTKADVIARPPVPDLQVAEMRHQVFGDTAIGTGVQVTPLRERFLHLWHRENGKWINVLVHETPMGSPRPPAVTMRPTFGPTVWPDLNTPDERDVIATQRALNETFAARDVTSYGRLTATDFVRVSPDGRTFSRDEFMKEVGASGPPRTDPNHSAFRVRVYGEIATISYLNRAADVQRVTRVVVKQAGVWRQLVTQATSVVGP